MHIFICKTSIYYHKNNALLLPFHHFISYKSTLMDTERNETMCYKFTFDTQRIRIELIFGSERERDARSYLIIKKILQEELSRFFCIQMRK